MMQHKVKGVVVAMLVVMVGLVVGALALSLDDGVSLSGSAADPGPRRSAPAYKIIVNGDHLYMMWPTDRPNPTGWKDAGFAGSEQDCLRYLEGLRPAADPLSPDGLIRASR